MIKHLFFLFSTAAALQASAQCDSTIVNSDLTISSDVLMGGTYVVHGTFKLNSNTTIYVTPYENNGCGALKIYADHIIINGTINGDYAGYTGGTGGAGASSVTSLTGHEASLTSCTDTGNHGKISVEGGKAGVDGDGPGAGASGANGGTGSGPKQYCGSSSDNAGVIGSGGGAGGGAGASYGGQGSDGAAGGNGSSVSVTNNFDVDDSYPVVAGTGGTGGATGATYGTADQRDIELGSGGAGAGGGGRSYNAGITGNKGGNGGGMIFLKAENSLTITGTLSVAGEDGQNGGNGGSGDATTDCCSDGCSGCSESTFSTGAGSGSGAGAGSGGGIYIETLGTASVTGELVATGGNGGNPGTKGSGTTCTYGGNLFCGSESISTGDGNSGGKGGAGGGGRIKIFVPVCSMGTINPVYQVDGGTGASAGGTGSYQLVCDYALGIEELNAGAEINVYPNPAADMLYIALENLSDEMNGQAQIQLINMQGAVVAEQTAEKNTTMNVQNLSTGVYTLKIQLNGGVVTRKIVKQ